jgi:hypothetical protein
VPSRVGGPPPPSQDDVDADELRGTTLRMSPRLRWRPPSRALSLERISDPEAPKSAPSMSNFSTSPARKCASPRVCRGNGHERIGRDGRRVQRRLRKPPLTEPPRRHPQPIAKERDRTGPYSPRPGDVEHSERTSNSRESCWGYVPTIDFEQGLRRALAAYAADPRVPRAATVRG